MLTKEWTKEARFSAQQGDTSCSTLIGLVAKACDEIDLLRPVSLTKLEEAINNLPGSSISTKRGLYDNGKEGLLVRKYEVIGMLQKLYVEVVTEAVTKDTDIIVKLKNFLAIIHKDEGQHTYKVGMEQSLLDAHKIWYGMLNSLEDAINTFKEVRPCKCGVTPLINALNWVVCINTMCMKYNQPLSRKEWNKQHKE